MWTTNLLHTLSILYMIKEMLNLYIHTSVIRITLHIKLTVQTTRYTTSSVPLYKNYMLFGLIISYFLLSLFLPYAIYFPYYESFLPSFFCLLSSSFLPPFRSY